MRGKLVALLTSLGVMLLSPLLLPLALFDYADPADDYRRLT